MLALQEIECLRKGDFDKSGKGPSNTRLPQMQACSTLHSIGVVFCVHHTYHENNHVKDFDIVQFEIFIQMLLIYNKLDISLVNGYDQN